MKSKKTYKKLFIILLTIYLVYVFVNQQKVINSYKTTQNYYIDQIEERIAYRETLYNKKANINSEDYIEEVAREKLDMYLPNERVYIDTCK